MCQERKRGYADIIAMQRLSKTTQRRCGRCMPPEVKPPCPGVAAWLKRALNVIPQRGPALFVCHNVRLCAQRIF